MMMLLLTNSLIRMLYCWFAFEIRALEDARVAATDRRRTCTGWRKAWIVKARGLCKAGCEVSLVCAALSCGLNGAK